MVLVTGIYRDQVMTALAHWAGGCALGPPLYHMKLFYKLAQTVCNHAVSAHENQARLQTRRQAIRMQPKQMTCAPRAMLWLAYHVPIMGTEMGLHTSAVKKRY